MMMDNLIEEFFDLDDNGILVLETPSIVSFIIKTTRKVSKESAGASLTLQHDRNGSFLDITIHLNENENDDISMRFDIANTNDQKILYKFLSQDKLYFNFISAGGDLICIAKAENSIRDRIIEWKNEQEKNKINGEPITKEIIAETLRHIREDEPAPYRPMKKLGKWQFDEHMKRLDRLIKNMK